MSSTKRMVVPTPISHAMMLLSCQQFYWLTKCVVSTTWTTLINMTVDGHNLKNLSRKQLPMLVKLSLMTLIWCGQSFVKTKGTRWNARAINKQDLRKILTNVVKNPMNVVKKSMVLMITVLWVLKPSSLSPLLQALPSIIVWVVSRRIAWLLLCHLVHRHPLVPPGAGGSASQDDTPIPVSWTSASSLMAIDSKATPELVDLDTSLVLVSKMLTMPKKFDFAPLDSLHIDLSH